MSIPEKGLYWVLISYAWLEGSIPSDVAEIALLANCKQSEVRKWWPRVSDCFRDRGDGQLIHPRVELEREKAIAECEKRSEAGRVAAKASWKKRKPEGDAIAMRSHGEDAGQSDAIALRSHQGKPDPAEAIALRFDANQIQNHSQNQKQTLSPPEVPSTPRARKHGERELDSRGDPSAQDFARWFIETGLQMGVLPPSFAIDVRLHADRQDQTIAAHMLEAHGREELEARSRRYFAAVAAKKLNAQPTIEILSKVWDHAEVTSIHPARESAFRSIRDLQERMAEKFEPRTGEQPIEDGFDGSEVARLAPTV